MCITINLWNVKSSSVSLNRYYSVHCTHLAAIQPVSNWAVETADMEDLLLLLWWRRGRSWHGTEEMFQNYSPSALCIKAGYVPCCMRPYGKGWKYIIKSALSVDVPTCLLVVLIRFIWVTISIMMITWCQNNGLHN